MIEERGQIVSREGDYAWVETERQSACSSCSAKKGCGTGVLSKVYSNRFSRVKALNHINAKPGEQVVIGLEEDALVRGSLVVYGLPLLTLILTALLGRAVAIEMGMQNDDGLIALFGIAGLFIGFFMVKIFNRKIAHDEHYQPIILRCCDSVSDSVLVDV